MSCTSVLCTKEKEGSCSLSLEVPVSHTRPVEYSQRERFALKKNISLYAQKEEGINNETHDWIYNLDWHCFDEREIPCMSVYVLSMGCWIATRETNRERIAGENLFLSMKIPTSETINRLHTQIINISSILKFLISTGIEIHNNQSFKSTHNGFPPRPRALRQPRRYAHLRLLWTREWHRISHQLPRANSVRERLHGWKYVVISETSWFGEEELQHGVRTGTAGTAGELGVVMVGTHSKKSWNSCIDSNLWRTPF